MVIWAFSLPDVALYYAASVWENTQNPYHGVLQQIRQLRLNCDVHLPGPAEEDGRYLGVLVTRGGVE